MIAKRVFLRLNVAFAVLAILVLVACNLAGTDNPSPAASPSPERLFTLVQLPTPNLKTVPAAQLARQGTPLPTNTALSDCEIAHEGLRTQYGIEAMLNWTTRQVQVNQKVIYRNDYTESLTELVFHVEPRRLANLNVMSFRHALTDDGVEIPGILLDGWRLAVPLPKAVEPGCNAVIQLQFTLQLQPYSGENPVGWLSYTRRQTNLGHWFPTIGLYNYQSPGQWFVPARHYIGEQATPEIADYTIRLQVENAPEGLQLAAPGHITQLGQSTWELRASRSRDFAISLSTEFQKSATTVGNVAVELYYFRDGGAKERSDPALRAIVDAKQSLALYMELFGDYPNDRMVVVEGDFPDGMEFSGLVFVSEAWFRTWNGQPGDWLTIITVHEMAHQWWYALVGNNQASNPYLDEALATYTELLYYEHYYPEKVDWWWQFRVLQYTSANPVDGTVYEYSSWRPYINAIYLRGVIMLQRIREEIGDEVFLAWLHNYAANYAWKLASPQDFWGSMPPQAYLLTADIRREYLRGADILPVVESNPVITTEEPAAN